MSRRPNEPRLRNQRGAPLDERLEQARLARQQMLERRANYASTHSSEQPKASVEKPPPEEPRYDAAVVEALKSIPFWQLGDAQKLAVSSTYVSLAEITIECLKERRREAVLCWPNCGASASAISTLLALADCAAAQPTTVEGIDALEPPHGLRALIYPYARTAHRGLRHIYVDKDYLGHVHTLHQVRSRKAGEDQALADFHKTLARTKTLSGLAFDGQSYDEFRHPCLDEVMPSGPCIGTDGRQELLWRTRSKTDLRKISRSYAADQPTKARFYIFGIRARDTLVPSIKAVGRNLDVVFLDLGSVGRSRLGRNWLERVKQFLKELDQRVGPIATVALTDDPWTFDTLRFDALQPTSSQRSAGKKKPRPTTSRVVFSNRPDIVAAPTLPQSFEYAEVKQHDVLGFSGEVEGLLQRLRANARRAEALHDQAAADSLRQLVATIRRCASLPASRRELSAYVEGEVGGMAAAELLASYQVLSPLKQLQDSIGPWAQLEGAERLAIKSDVERIWANTAQLTPMAPLLRDVVSRFLRVSSRTVFLLRNDMLADFASHALSNDLEIGEAVASRLEKEMFLLLDRDGFSDLALLPTAKRNAVKTLVIVAPTRAQILSLLAQPWLPSNLIVLGDSDTLQSCASDARRLASNAELKAIEGRLTGFAAKAEKVVHRAGPASVENEPTDDVEFPFSAIVNLAGKVRPDQSTIRLRLSGEQTIIARPGTKLILQDNARTVPIFTEAEAREVDRGDRICVVGDAFLAMARPLLNITVRAAEEIRDYHDLVSERFARIPGDTQTARLAGVVASMGLPDVTVQRAAYWVDLEAQRDLPLHEVVPHAPRDRATFLAFMRALGVAEQIALRYWSWAVIAQRSSRIRAATSFHDAYRTILIDNYAAQSSNPERSREIRQLKVAAEDFVGTVVEKAILRGDDAAA